jgi:hypothetical protein
VTIGGVILLFMSPAPVDLNERLRAYLLAIFETDQALS